MKNTVQVPKLTEQGQKQYTRHRKLNLSRNNIKIKQASKPFTRLKSNHQIQQPENNTSKLTGKPLSSMGKRPASSRKYTDTANSLATTSSAKSEEEVKQIIGTVFSHSKKLHSFLQQKQLDQKQAYNILVNNQLFTLSLVTMVSNKSEQDINKYVEKSCVHKLDRVIAMEKQKNICESIENKIGELINQRIKALSQFS